MGPLDNFWIKLVTDQEMTGWNFSPHPHSSKVEISSLNLLNRIQGTCRLVHRARLLEGGPPERTWTLWALPHLALSIFPFDCYGSYP